MALRNTCGRLPKRNIHWQDIPRNTAVKDCGSVFVAGTGRNRKVVFWGSQDARRAQTSLAAWSRRGVR